MKSKPDHSLTPDNPSAVSGVESAVLLKSLISFSPDEDKDRRLLKCAYVVMMHNDVRHAAILEVVGAVRDSSGTEAGASIAKQILGNVSCSDDESAVSSWVLSDYCGWAKEPHEWEVKAAREIMQTAWLKEVVSGKYS